MLLAAGLAGAAVATLVAGAPTRRGAGVPGPRRGVGGRRTDAAPVVGSADRQPAGPPDPAGDTMRWARPASILAAVAVWALLGGAVGAITGVAVAAILPILLARLEPGSARRRRLALVRAAPVVADLLAAALSAGVPVEQALPVVARAVGGPAQSVLLGVHRRIELGEPAESAWAALADVPGIGGLAGAVARSSRTGAPLAALLSLTAEDLRAQAAAAALVAGRATAVRSVLPLGLCLLPAFALLGIVPVVGGLLPSF